MNMMRESIRAIFILLIAVISLLLLIIGLLSPLTPSEGTPILLALFVFAGLPILLPCIGIAIAKKTSEKIFTIVVEILMVSIIGWWVLTIGRLLFNVT
jgi:hypothetical protein